MGAALSVVVPTMNEELGIAGLLDSLGKQQQVSLEVIVVDGGSSDATVELARTRGALVLETDAGRAIQMNAGAAAASNEFVLFLHADSAIADEGLLAAALRELRAHLDRCRSDRVAGHFSLRFVREAQQNDFAYYYYESKSALNRIETTNGDQGFLMKRSFFDLLGGFDESLPFLEDQRFAAMVRECGEWITLPGVLGTSARRFEQEGLGRRMTLSALIMAFHSIGFTEFFREAPEVYREQSVSRGLSLAPFFRLIHKLYWRRGVIKSLKDWLSIGKYVRRNAWQLFYVVDVLDRFEGREESGWLKFHDRWFTRATDFPVADAATALLTYVWFLSAWIWFEVADN